ncbi:CusA/CzcA family heavy metal efflux RND transporter [Plebeiibacterium sediminum]|uniref:CusA/CzcA family heavy metal efflux RND transporter n=1 Tax=Plebeiibacterium sediminum TaxID=2992112 RepID=A0AAE3M270_9BACT|nr:CusA/CzcA family heavy metal efflux RND transporter [Plebeiobacterium sediminum]MCW3785379.1 CusA/CzcA family heavy metal efflux RND transporter [Plebeiobacterium sediminum]
MLEKIISFSIRNKLIVILFTLTIVGFGLFSIYKIPVGTVPDITNNQVQVITTSGNLSTQEIEQFITTPVEMEMANLPGVLEIRSISKFGISLVTVVFEENLGTFLPRQLIAEKIKNASELIPESYGTPEMGPISTGLGEIYQYILDVKPGYEKNYSPMDLRTIQDWIVKRRLTGVTGVVEVNSWGGYLKQYEVAIDPLLLKSLDVSLMEVYDALEKNNNISGGSYIEKNNQSYFIRGDGQIKSIEDIKNIVVTSHAGVPVYVRDVAKVHFGHANRFGAITANGKGETILGQVMMLKNANSKEVINAVKERVDEIQKNLPEGVFINPVLERGELIAKTSFTVAENLILGALIVFITVLILLGNMRSALVIASMIPLALLFTISMMYIFGIDANLMSLGALDFGIIIDGAVIIVEYIVLRMSQMTKEAAGINGEQRREFSDQISEEGASKMMKSAIFGQIIILIVFIPILSLQGVEGKMFHPMALAFSFAIIGAMIMGLTWLPVASSLFLRPGDLTKRNLSKWILDQIYKSYYPVIKWSCEHKKIVLSAALISLIVTGFLFFKIGGEFVPTLDEGDFVIQPALKTGTSLSETIHMTTKMENILIKEFPDEVDQIVCRIGAAEVPTDPMSMEEIDMIIKLKPKKQWVKAGKKEDLAVAFKEALSIIPGIDYEFTQPIEMRFNELITGVRSDIAIKIYGEDLDYINEKANEIKKLVSDIPGAGDVILEKTTGLPQIKVTYNRSQIAYYNVDVDMLNTYLSTAFGGEIAGVVFEGERRFDMVMRLQNTNRTDIEDIRNLLVTIPSGTEVPMSEFADIQYTKGPAKISRDNTRRRVVVSVNVRNRDLQSVVDDIRLRIDENIKLQPGNFIEYGGQFENLQNATKRLLIAVPVALLLIFIFLHFAFQSFKDALMIFTAIPLATVGGVVLLWLRGMPFSVSAGVGFIALFGIAVLNGIVLIEHLKELQEKGGATMREIIIQGTKDRLRPVLLTAGAAAMGFLPMAISTGAGAEVQRPLATVVIGGLVTSTMLTMIALPLFFEIFYNIIGIKLFPFKLIRSKGMLVLLLLLPVSALFSQNNELNLQQLRQIALENNKQLKAYELKSKEAQAILKTSFSIPKTALSYGTDENNIAENNHPLKVWAVGQEFAFPTLYTAQRNANEFFSSMAQTKYELEKNRIYKEVSISYYQCVFINRKINIYRQLDSVYTDLLKQFERRYELKDASRLEYLNIKSKKNEVSYLQMELDADYLKSYRQLKMLINNDSDFTLPIIMEVLTQGEMGSDSVLIYNLLQQKNTYAESLVKVEQNKVLPEFSVNYFIGSNSYENAKNYQGFEVGVSIPVFYKSYRNTIKSAKLAYDAQKYFSETEMDEVKQKMQELNSDKLKYDMKIKQYQETDLPLAEEIKRTAIKAYQLKEIDFMRLANSLESAFKIESDYYESINNYNKALLEIIYFTK